MGYNKLVRQKQLLKALLLVFTIVVSDYKRLDTSLYFLTTNFHTEIKRQVNISHDMNPLKLT